MRIAGIVAEYNPFHSGHAYHVTRTRDAGADAVIAVMSGNFVQRGEPAILSKWARAEAAVRGGVDLVLELPVYWAAAPAQRFASGAVSVLRRCGCADRLSFGSECGDTDRLAMAAQAIRDPAVSAAMQPYLAAGETFAAARERAVEEVCGEQISSVLRAPNDTLAVEYLLAAAAQGASFEPLAVRRTCAHDAPEMSAETLSASAVREMLRAGESGGIPESTRAVWEREAQAGLAPTDLTRLEREILLRLRTADAETIRALPDVSEGLENRLLRAARKAGSLDELYALTKTKRYTHARIRRIVLSLLLDIRAADIPPQVPYLRPLAIGEKGEAILREIRRFSDTPILSRVRDVQTLPQEAQRVFRAECRAGEVFALTLPRVAPAGEEMSRRMLRVL